MKLPMRDGRVSAFFKDPRPLSNPGLHVHGALDVTSFNGDTDRMVYAPASGKTRAYVMLRPPQADWSPAEKPEIRAVPVHNYFYDVYGGVVVIEEPNGRYHIMTHFYAKPLEQRFGKFALIETIRGSRWPLFLLHSSVMEIKKGDALLNIGSAGYSTGPHVHWEVHHSSKLDAYEKRIDPTEYIEH